MKVLIVSNMFPDDKHPSAGIFVKKFCDELARLNIKYDLSVMYRHDTFIRKIYGYLKFYIGTFFRLLLKKYDVVYIHYASHSSFPVLLASKFKRLTIYTNVHGSDVVPESITQERFQKYTKKILKKSHRIIVPSEYFREYVANKYCIDKKTINIYPSSGVDMSLFTVLSEDKKILLKRKYGIDNRFLTFCYVGRITANKGWDTFLNAAAKIISKNKNVNFLFVGDGNEKDEYYALIEKKGLKSYVRKYSLLPQKELVNIYNVSDAFVFPTRREGESLGLVAIEAMACGTPVISSNFAAPKYYIIDDYNGYKFQVDNADQLADIMEKFIVGEYSKEKMTINCIKTACAYDSKNIQDKLKDIFEVLNHVKI